MSVAAGSGQSYALDLIKDSRHRSAAAARDVADWLGRLEIERKAPRTVDAYERSVARLLRMFPERALAEFNEGDLTQVLRTFPPTSRHTSAGHIRLFFEWAELVGRIDKSPTRIMPKVKPPARQHTATFNEAEVALLEALQAPHGPRMSILFRTGIRMSEARGLQAKHVLFDEQRLIVYGREGDVGAKGGKDRIVHLRNLLPILDEWFTLDGINDDDYLWWKTYAGKRPDRSSPIVEGSFYLWWRKAIELAGIDLGVGKRRRTVHSTRHTFGSNWARKGGQPERLQRMMGHTSIKTTYDYYVDVLDTDVLADLELVEA